PLHVKEPFLNFFKEKFQPHVSSIDFPSISTSNGLNPSDRDMLEKEVTLSEIKNVLDIHEFVSKFFGSKKMPAGSNSSFIILIPKVSNPIHIKYFRPISLINIHYKFIAKVLANQLSKVVNKIVSHEQSAFILGRQILDSPLMLSEMIDWYRKRKKKMLIFKIDFEKAFDLVCWKYLDYVLQRFGFGLTWRLWIKAYLESSRTSILVNKSPTSEFFVKRGLRQGDPLLPFLFILVMEGHHIALSEATHTGLIFHIFYADDAVITTDWSSTDMDNIIRAFLKRKLVHLGSFPFTYLGLLIGSNMNHSSNWKILIDRFQSRLSKWKANLFSIGGRLTLIKSVLGSLGSSKLAWVKWPTVLASLSKGGLGIGSLMSFNLALLQK
ncbi:putative RNA-directed DNA polymerase, eukaryota, reverse transcriptase zinc-binding domain protein, partial [Tanacetum coccineum]